MKILLCVEFFHPSVGGAQEVVKQIATRLAKKGHDVCIATTSIPNRLSHNFGEVRIKSFDITGNLSRGMSGEMELYRKFILDSNFDVIFIYAAQQWTLDAMIEILPNIRAKKVLVPCGFSGLYEDLYSDYFDLMPKLLKQFDALIFHSKNYRDYQFAEKNNIQKLFLVPNGADNYEFQKIEKANFRTKFNIENQTLILLTVGQLNGQKGHLEVAGAVAKLKINKPICLVLNGNSTSHGGRVDTLAKARLVLTRFNYDLLKRAAFKLASKLMGRLKVVDNYFSKLNALVSEINSGCYGQNKHVILSDMSRKDLIDCYFDANLFIFASKIEYSPLVLFEASAAGLPFITVPVGNSVEIAQWTKAGVICPATIDEKGYTFADDKLLAECIENTLSKPDKLMMMSEDGRTAFLEKFNWDHLVDEYEKILSI